MLTKLSFFILILFCSFLGNAQTQINCGGVNQVIPLFTKGFPESSDSGPLFDKGVLKPITSSQAQFELRVFVRTNQDCILVIKCVNKSVRADRYFTLITTIKETPKEVIDTYENLGSYGADTSRHFVVLCKRDTNLKANPGTSWNQIFSALIKNHLYDLPDQDVLDKMALRDNPKAFSTLTECCGTIIELKVGDHYRYIRLATAFHATSRTAKFLEYEDNILKILSQFLN
jgi:hypothetical protein